MVVETERARAAGAGAKGPGREVDPENLTNEDLLVPELVDAALARICRGSGGVDLALGRTLADLEVGDRLIALGRSDLAAYAVETLGMTASRARFLSDTARALADRPLLTRAVASGAVSLRKAALVAHVAKGDAEPAWTAACLHKTEKELTDLVRSAGSVPREIDLETESALWLMTPEEQDRFDRGIAVARILIGFHRDLWPAIEAMAMEAISSLAPYVPEDPVPPPEKPTAEEEAAAKARYEEWVELFAGETDSILELIAVVEEATAVTVGKDEAEPLPPDPREAAKILDERARRLHAVQDRFAEPLCRLAQAAIELGVPAAMGFPSLEFYCRERLRMSARTFRQYAWLERRMRRLPEIREELIAGRITLTKARALAKAANDETVKERIERAAKTSTEQTEREAEEEERRRNRKKGVRKVWGPREVLVTLRLAIATAQAAARAQGVTITTGEALAWIADHFVSVNAEAVRRLLRRVKPERWEILMQFAGLCAVPGCRRPASHIHHIQFKSRGGGEKETNKIPLCHRDHLAGVHRGYVVFEGQRGAGLIYRVETGDAVSTEEWEISAEGKVVRRATADADADADAKGGGGRGRTRPRGHGGKKGAGAAASGAGVSEPRPQYGVRGEGR